MRVSEAMTRDVRIASPRQSIREVATIMGQIDSGVMPVGDNDRLVGMITDRDIAVRAVAAGKGPETPVQEVMSQEVKYCYDDEELEHVAKNMAETLGDVAVSEGEQTAAKAIEGVSQPGGPHSQGGTQRNKLGKKQR